MLVLCIYAYQSKFFDKGESSKMIEVASSDMIEEEFERQMLEDTKNWGRWKLSQKPVRWQLLRYVTENKKPRF